MLNIIVRLLCIKKSVGPFKIDKFQDVLEMVFFCYFDTLRVGFKTPPENRLVKF